MRKLSETEIYSQRLRSSQKSAIVDAMDKRLYQGQGVISPSHISSELLQLKIKSKNAMHPLSDAISLYEKYNGRIQLFDLGATSAGRSPIPLFMPFLPGRARNLQTKSTGGSGLTPTLYMNMYRVGKWSADETQYLGVSVITDLRATLESAYIAYAILIDQKGKKVFDNKVVLETLSNIYTSLFSNAMIRTMVTYGSDFNSDAARYVIAKFFQLYVLKKPATDTVDRYAYNTIKFRHTLSSLKNFEEISGIVYDSLSDFLKTFGLAFFSEPVSIQAFERSWLSMYGEGLALAIEYVPYLMHFLFSAYHGAMLGGATKLYKRLAELQKDGLVKLYNAVVSEIR